jgi:hypothetical protein
MQKYLIPTILWLVMSGMTLAQPQIKLDKIKQIKLLETDRSQIKKILQNYKAVTFHSSLPSTESDYNQHFVGDDALIELQYAGSKCGENYNDFDVPEGKVTSIHIFPKKLVDPKDIGFDLSKYKTSWIPYQGNFYYDDESGTVLQLSQGKTSSIHFIPTKKHFSILCNKWKAEKFSSVIEVFRDRKFNRYWLPPPADVSGLKLNRTEIVANCPLSRETKDKKCNNKIKPIKITTLSTNPTERVLTYNYSVSGGKIVGKGAKVIWDLSGVKPGNYTITAAVDDDCGFCGKTLTKQVVVKECPDCNPK